MNYEVVNLEEKIVAGLKIRTSNGDPNMEKAIGKLWQSFFENGVYHSISNKQNDKTIGLYTNYENDVNGAYDVMVCCEVGFQLDQGSEIYIEKIPTGRYAKFIVKGHMQKAVAEGWNKIWSMDLDRKYSCDFEEYQSGGDMDHTEVHIYIALNK